MESAVKLEHSDGVLDTYHLPLPFALYLFYIGWSTSLLPRVSGVRHRPVWRCYYEIWHGNTRRIIIHGELGIFKTARCRERMGEMCIWYRLNEILYISRSIRTLLTSTTLTHYPHTNFILPPFLPSLTRDQCPFSNKILP